MKEIDISVVIPVFNTEKYISDAIESTLSQTLKPGEIIVVDDGSTDNTVNEISRFGDPVRIIRCTHRGAGAARNEGVRAARHSYLAFLDADDLWVPEKLALQVALIKAHPETDMVFGNVRQFISPEIPAENAATLKKELEQMPGYTAGTLLIRMETFLKIGFFNENLRIGEFIEWYGRATDGGLSGIMPGEICLLRRIHEANTMIVRKTALKDYTTILREAIARKKNKN